MSNNETKPVVLPYEGHVFAEDFSTPIRKRAVISGELSVASGKLLVVSVEVAIFSTRAKF